MVWYFIGGYMVSGTLHGCLEIQNFSSRVEEILHSFAVLIREKQHSKRNFVFLRGNVLSSMSIYFFLILISLCH